MNMTRLLTALVVAALSAAAAHADDPSELVFAFQKQKDPNQIREHADQVAAFLTKEIGLPVKAFIPSDYAASVQAMVSGKADIMYSDSFPYLLARRDAGAKLLLAELRPDIHGNERTDYDSVFVVRKDSPIQSIEELVSQAKSQRMVFTSTTSTSGYVMAYWRLVKEGLLEPRQDPRTVFASVNFGGGYTQALQQVIDGRADVAAVSHYTVEGKKADVYLKPEERAKLRILARTPGVPTHVICARGALSDALLAKVKAALLKLSQEQPELLADVYGAAKLTEVDPDQHVASVTEALEYLGIDVSGLVKLPK